jgi:nucleotide-binding universal stress UspA family protein
MAEPVTRKKILLAVDGSGMSEATVHYVADTMYPAETEVFLFHVFNKIPETFWDREQEPELDFWMNKMKSQEREHEKAVEHFMQDSRQTLLDAGFREQNVIIGIRDRVVGIARDIVTEAAKGYDMLVMGRTGMSQVKGVTVGSVANKVIGSLQQLPICVVTGRPENKNIIVAIDGSVGSMRAVKFLSSFRNISSRQIVLFHAVRRIGFQHGQAGVENPFEALEQSLFEDARRMIAPSLQEARSRLLDAGCPNENISENIVSGVASRAGALVEQSRVKGCGSLVVGRKGISQVEDFNIGRVCHKVIQQAQDVAVWVVP